MGKNSITSDSNHIAVLTSHVEELSKKIETLKNRNFLLLGENLMLKDANEFPRLCKEQNRRDLFRNAIVERTEAVEKLIGHVGSCFPFRPETVEYQVKRLFGDKAFCSGELCPCFRFCSVVAAKGPVTSLKRKGTVSVDSTRKNTVHFSRTVHKGRIELTSPIYGTLNFSGSDWKEASKKIRDHFKASPIEGLTDSAIAGFTHKGADNKLAAAFG